MAAPSNRWQIISPTVHRWLGQATCAARYALAPITLRHRCRAASSHPEASTMTPRVAIVLGLVLTAASACVPNDPCDGDLPNGSAEMLTWWTASSEQEAVRALLELHNKLNPDSLVYSTTIQTSEDAAEALEGRFLVGAPPDTFQVNIGRALSKWLQDLLIADVSDARYGIDWNTFNSSLTENLNPNGGAAKYCVPINIHRNNTLFYNVKLLQERNIGPPSTLAELEAACDIFDREGITPILLPLATGSPNYWTLSLLAHESLLPAIGGADYYMKFWKGTLPDPFNKEGALAKSYARLVNWTRQGYIISKNVLWNIAVDEHFLGKDRDHQAAFVVMGDWAKGELDTRYQAGTDFGAAPFPPDMSTPGALDNQVFVFTADCFPLTIAGARKSSGGLRLLKTIASSDGQIAFSSKKGSLPALEVPESQLDTMQQKTYANFTSASTHRVLAVSGLQPRGALGDVDSAVFDMFTHTDDQRGLHFWELWYPQLRNHADAQ